MKLKKIISFSLICCILLSVAVLCVGAADSYPIESYYSRSGGYNVSTVSYESGVLGYGEYKAWYPSDMTGSNRKYPVIVYCNGTTIHDDVPYTVDLMKLLASHGFICLTSDHVLSGHGDSASAELDFFLNLDKQKGSLFYGKIDRNKIGICGHSQGATGALNAVSQGKYSNGYMFRSVCAVSPPSEDFAASLIQNTPYDASKVSLPTFLIGGTTVDEIAICPLDKSLMASFEKIKNSNVVVGRITGADHLDTQDEAAGYITAWFRWTLCGDSYAAGAFTGKNPELFRNGKWQDVISRKAVGSQNGSNGDGGIELPSRDDVSSIIGYITGTITAVIKRIIKLITDIIT